MKYFILLPFHMNITSLNMFRTSPFCSCCLPDIATWSYQTRGIHLVITSWHISSSPFHIGSFVAFRRICLSYINKSFVMKMSYLLPRANCYELPSSWRGVTSFHVKTLNYQISRTSHIRIPVFILNWDLVTSIIYTKNHTTSSTRTWRIWPLSVPFDPAAAARGRR